MRLLELRLVYALVSGCGAEVGEDGIHGLSYHYRKGCHFCHAAFNDIVKCSLDSAKVPSHLEPSGLYRSDGKCPDGATVVPWQGRKILVWDAICSDTLAPSLRDVAIREPGAVAAAAEHRKRSKYLYAVESLSVLGEDARSFFRDLAKCLEAVNDDRRSHQFLLQRVAVALQRGTAASVLGSIASRN